MNSRSNKLDEKENSLNTKESEIESKSNALATERKQLKKRATRYIKGKRKEVLNQAWAIIYGYILLNVVYMVSFFAMDINLRSDIKKLCMGILDGFFDENLPIIIISAIGFIALVIGAVVLHLQVTKSQYAKEIRISMIASLNLCLILKALSDLGIFYFLIPIAWGIILYLLLKREKPYSYQLTDPKTFEQIYDDDFLF